MTPAQERLARHALGLPNSTGRSTRNADDVTMRGGVSWGLAALRYDEWVRMREAGLAEIIPSAKRTTFSLTRSGALAALEPGETLNPEDFPMEEQAR
ncbi:hypothetical protein ATO13_22301 [Stappia sp. 22II-S9-Z10]|nr:hypothetical protein ATO13_22301 [Stappia sp. 22II-S9-Z10]